MNSWVIARGVIGRNQWWGPPFDGKGTDSQVKGRFRDFSLLPRISTELPLPSAQKEWTTFQTHSPCTYAQVK